MLVDEFFKAVKAERTALDPNAGVPDKWARSHPLKPISKRGAAATVCCKSAANGRWKLVGFGGNWWESLRLKNAVDLSNHWD